MNPLIPAVSITGLGRRGTDLKKKFLLFYFEIKEKETFCLEDPYIALSIYFFLDFGFSPTPLREASVELSF